MRIINYFREAVSELHRVTWPTQRQAVRISLVVLAVTFVVAFALGFLDTFFAWGYQQLLKLAI